MSKGRTAITIFQHGHVPTHMNHWGEMMKNTIRGVASSVLLLVSLSQVTYAATSSHREAWNQRTIYAGSTQVSAKGIAVGTRQHQTEYIAVTSIIQSLRSLGYVTTWTARTSTLDITMPRGMTAKVKPAKAIHGYAAIRLHGTAIVYSPMIKSTDAKTHSMTTYLPITFLDQALTSAQITTSYNGRGWTLAKKIIATKVGPVTEIANLTANYTHPAAGQWVNLTGTAKDAQGHPVPNATLLLTGSNDQNSNGVNTNTYAFGSVAIAFAKSTVAYGDPASTQVGLPVTTDAQGHFSVRVQDTNAAQDQYSLWPVAKGVVSSNTPLDSRGRGYSVALAWGNAVNLSHIVTYASLPNAVSPSDSTNMSGVISQEGQLSTVYFAPVSTTNALLGQSLTYNLTASNDGLITAIDGVKLANPTSQTTLHVTCQTATYTLSVPGGFVDATGKQAPTVTLMAGGQDAYDTLSNSIDQAAPLSQGSSSADPELFSVGVVNSITGDTNLRVSSGSISATQTIQVMVGAPTQLGPVSPAKGFISSGGTTTATLTVEDSAGNPVANTMVPISFVGHLDPLWITAINGVTLTSTISGTVVPTPIPLYEPTGWMGSGDTIVGPYTTLSVPGLYSDSVVGTAYGAVLDVYTNAQGQINLTLQNGNVSYYDKSSSTGTTASDTTVNGSGTLYVESTGSAADGNFSVVLSDSAVPTNQSQITY